MSLDHGINTLVIDVHTLNWQLTNHIVLHLIMKNVNFAKIKILNSLQTHMVTSMLETNIIISNCGVIQ